MKDPYLPSTKRERYEIKEPTCHCFFTSENPGKQNFVGFGEKYKMLFLKKSEHTKFILRDLARDI